MALKKNLLFICMYILFSIELSYSGMNTADGCRAVEGKTGEERFKAAALVVGCTKGPCPLVLRPENLEYLNGLIHSSDETCVKTVQVLQDTQSTSTAIDPGVITIEEMQRSGRPISIRESGIISAQDSIPRLPCRSAQRVTSGGDDCNDFHNSVVIDNPSFDELTQLGSKFTIMDNILSREGSEEYCNTCFFENQRLETLFDDFDVDNLSSSWLKSSVEKVKDGIGFFTFDKDQQLFNGLKQSIKTRVANRLTVKSAQQEILKISNIMQQYEHMKYRYGLDDDLTLSCSSSAEIESKINSSCSANQISKTNIKKRIQGAFSTVNTEFGRKPHSLEENFSSMMDKIKVSKKQCDNQEKITRENFYNYDYVALSSLGFIEASSAFIDAVDLEKIIESNPSEPPYKAISEAIVEELLSQSGSEKIRKLFGEESSLSDTAKKSLEEWFGIKIPFNRSEYLGEDKDENLKKKDILKNHLASQLSRTAISSPNLNAVLFDWDNLKSMQEDFKSVSGVNFSKFLLEGNSSDTKEEMKKRFKKLYGEKCQQIQQNLVKAICRPKDSLENFSHDDIVAESKDLLDELRDKEDEAKLLASFALGSFTCNENNAAHSTHSQIVDLSRELPLNSQSDVLKEALAKDVSEGRTVGYLETFAASGRNCSHLASNLDSGRFQCSVYNQCQSLVQTASQANVDEVSSIETVSSSTYTSVDSAARESVEAVQSGASYAEVEEEIYSEYVATQEGSKESTGSDNLSGGGSQVIESEILSSDLELDNTNTDNLDDADILTADSSDDSIPDLLTDQDDTDYSEIFQNPLEGNLGGTDFLNTNYSYGIDPQGESDNITTADIDIQDQQERAALIGKLSGRYTPSELEAMSLEQLRGLASTITSTTEQAKDMDLSDLEEKRKRLEAEIASLEQQKMQSQIDELERSKSKLTEEKQKIAEERKEQGLPEKVVVADPATSSAVVPQAASRSIASIAPATIGADSRAALPARTFAEGSLLNTGADQQLARGKVSGGAQSRTGLAVKGAVGKQIVLTSKIPSDLTQTKSDVLGAKVKEYLEAAEASDLLQDQSFVKFETENDQLVAVYVQSEDGELVRVELSKLDESSRQLVGQYQRLSESEILEKEQSVDQQLAKLEQDMIAMQAAQSSRKARLDVLRLKLSIYDQEIRAKQ